MTGMYCPYGGGVCEYACILNCGKDFQNLIQCRDYWSKINDKIISERGD